MSAAPSWPRLAGWLATAQPPAARGCWRVREGGRESSGTFAYLPPGDAQAVTDAGVLSDDFSPLRLWSFSLERGEDYHRPAGPVVAVEHDGRPAWQVQLVPPSHKSGLLTLVVDDATGLLLRQSNDDHDRLEEVTGLELGVRVTDDDLVPLRRQQQEQAREQRRFELWRSRPVPTPGWFPWRRLMTDEQPDCWVVTSDRGDGSLGRAPLGTPAPVAEWLSEPQVHRLDRGGWSWAIASDQPMQASDAARVVDEALAAEG